MRNGNWKVFSDNVLGMYVPSIRRPATARKMRQVLEEFGELVRGPAELTPATIARWIQLHPERRPETVCALLRSLRAACVYGARFGELEANPFDWRKPHEWVDWDVPELPPPVHSEHEVAAVLQRADLEAQGGDWKAARLRAVVYGFAYTGARKREVLALRTQDVDLLRGLLSIRTNTRRRLKTRSSAAQIAVPEVLARVLESWIPRTWSEWLFPGVERKGPWLEGPPGEKPLDQVKALGLRAGVEGFTILSLRHSFASCAEGWQIGELALQRQLRHTRIRTQLAYRHPLPEVLRDVGAKVRYLVS